MPRIDRRRVGTVLGVLAVIVVGGGTVMMYGFLVDETRFDRPSAEFDVLRSDVAAVPGVRSVDAQRWVEAPTFSVPSSWVRITADAEAIPAVLDTACSTTYPEAVSWNLDVDTAAGTGVSLHADATHGCPDFGVDPGAVVAELDRLVPGIRIYASVGQGRRLVLSSVEEPASGFADVLPLVENADDLRRAAGIGPDAVVEVGASLLIVDVEAGRGSATHSLLTTLADRYDVTGFFAGGSGTPVDGVDKVQVTAPAQHHAAITETIAGSGLPFATLPVAFLG